MTELKNSSVKPVGTTAAKLEKTEKMLNRSSNNKSATNRNANSEKTEKVEEKTNLEKFT